MSPRKAMLVLAAAGLVMFGSSDAFARLGSGFSFGSRSTRSFSTVPSTPTAPRVAPFNGAPGYANQGLLRPSGSRGLFGGMGRGFFGGLLGAGLFGLLLGHGLFGGFGGFFSLIGLLLQIGLIVLLVRFAIGLFRSRPSFAGMGGLPGGPGTSFRTASNRFGGTPSPQPAPSSPLAIETADFEAFEAILQRMQKAFSDEDVATLRGLSTPEMAAEFERELADNRAHGAVNRISDVRLLRGDLAESWREAGADFASAAMQFSLIDAMIDRASGRVVQGDANVAQQVTEVWTFTRSPASGPAGWRLAAIQQAG